MSFLRLFSSICCSLNKIVSPFGIVNTASRPVGTRAAREQYEMIREKYPQACYDPVSRILKIEKEGKARKGKAAVCTAGTADIPLPNPVS